jgi:hypothetical protein
MRLETTSVESRQVPRALKRCSAGIGSLSGRRLWRWIACTTCPQSTAGGGLPAGEDARARVRAMADAVYRTESRPVIATKERMSS